MKAKKLRRTPGSFQWQTETCSRVFRSAESLVTQLQFFGSTYRYASSKISLRKYPKLLGTIVNGHVDHVTEAMYSNQLIAPESMKKYSSMAIAKTGTSKRNGLRTVTSAIA